MKVHDLYDEQGRLRAFEIDTSSISRGTVIMILRSIPGLVVKRSETWHRFYRAAKFCEFELGGSMFEASDPGDERSRFWLGPSSVAYSQQMDLVKSAFLRHGPPRWNVPVRILSVSMLGLGALAFGLSRLLDPSLPGLDAVAFVSAGAILVGALLMAWNILRERGSSLPSKS